MNWINYILDVFLCFVFKQFSSIYLFVHVVPSSFIIVPFFPYSQTLLISKFLSNSLLVYAKFSVFYLNIFIFKCLPQEHSSFRTHKRHIRHAIYAMSFTRKRTTNQYTKHKTFNAGLLRLHFLEIIIYAYIDIIIFVWTGLNLK